MDIIDVMKDISKDQAISDLHLTAKNKPVIRYNGQLKDYKSYPKQLELKEIEKIAKELMNQDQWKHFEEYGEVDFSYGIPGYCRFRVNAFKQRGSISMALRIIPQNIPTIEELGLPDILKKLAMQRKGLVLCTGPTGSGKSTTLASMIDVINNNKNAHVITLEDPIEYLHSHKNSIVHQREVGSDTKSFANGLRAALRQDPAIILVGEMRD